MKKILATLVLLASIAVITKAQNGPVMSFEKTEIDYSNVVQNSDGMRLFKFKNTGTEPLVIKNARGSCGCTVPKWPNDPIKPGQTAVIEVKYDTNRLGVFNKTITVDTNEAAGSNSHIIKIKGNVFEKKFEHLLNAQSSGKGK
jgi:Protein of unknown function (DUF1573)